ncbi:hypothetical protein HDV05_002925, partial [Chytridiales sp. JEL 0842]
MVENLKPETYYVFKLRVWDDSEGEFSKSYKEVSTITNDEGYLRKETLQLFRAVAENNVPVVESILNSHGRQIGIESRDKNGRTPLMIACQKGGALMVNLLLSHSADPHATTPSHKTPLHIAVSAGNLQAIQTLLNSDPSIINIPDHGGSTPLIWACENANANKYGYEVVQELIERGANIKWEDANGLTCLERLCMTSGNAKVARLLLENGSRLVDRIDKNHSHSNGKVGGGLTTLMLAALNGKKDLVIELVEGWKADVYAKTEHGQTAFSMAEGAGHGFVAEYLQKKMKYVYGGNGNGKG